MSKDKFTLNNGNDAREKPEAIVIPDVKDKPEAVLNPEAEAKPMEDISKSNEQTNLSSKKKSKMNTYNIIRIICLIGFLVFTGLFINEVIIQPIKIKNSIDLTRDLYNKPTEAPNVTSAPAVTIAAEPTGTVAATPTPDPNRDAKGRLLQFADLLATNEDVKGWITIPNTNIDYVVMQPTSDNDPNYYLYKDIKGDYSKAGTLFIDPSSSLENKTQNVVIHGHNMVSTVEKMFHFLLQYKKVNYYKEHPLITFDSIYNTGKWKIFAVFITNGSNKKEPLFDYRKSTFTSSSDFLNFIYQIRLRSELNVDTVDVNENDQILTLSTCSYELDNYRTVIVARKVREGEDTSVDVESITRNKSALYPESYYYRYGGKAPEVAATFEEALANGDIKWYTAPTDTTTK